MSKTLKELRDRLTRLTDNENSSFISEEEYNDYLNDSLADLREFVITQAPELFIDPDAYSFSTVADQAVYTLADNHYQVYAVDLVDGNSTYNIERQTFRARNKWQNVYVSQSITSAPYFRFHTPTNDKLQFTPAPSGVYTINVWYIPSYTILTSDTDRTPNQLEDNWLNCAVYDAAIKCKIKSEEPVAEFIRMREDIRGAIQNTFLERLTNSTHYATDVYRGFSNG